ncbi:MAG: MerC domain-containing protein [Bacteroidia bacterium]|nr:MerC domain-containing protein [Bacteroidia bacterium]
MKIRSFFSDYLGIISASLCLIHCLVAPAFMGAYVHAHNHGSHAAGESIFLHHAWDYFFLVVGFIAVLFSAKHSHQPILKALLWLTFAFLAASILLESWAPLLQNLVYFSSLGLITVHILNIRHWWKHSQAKTS